MCYSHLTTPNGCCEKSASCGEQAAGWGTGGLVNRQRAWGTGALPCPALPGPARPPSPALLFPQLAAPQPASARHLAPCFTPGTTPAAAPSLPPPCSRLHHPNLIAIRDAFVRPSATGQCRLIGGKLVNLSVDVYIAMELADGGDLFHLRGQMSSGWAGGRVWVCGGVGFEVRGCTEDGWACAPARMRGQPYTAPADGAPLCPMLPWSLPPPILQAMR